MTCILVEVRNGMLPLGLGRQASRCVDLRRDLYVQALSAFQADREDDELSYFQISGKAG
jgi:hypothetical protein